MLLRLAYPTLPNSFALLRLPLRRKRDKAERHADRSRPKTGGPAAHHPLRPGPDATSGREEPELGLPVSAR
jgi:hypothetical protein